MDVVAAGPLNIPKIGFGTWHLTGDACRDSVIDAIGAGYRYVDTAQRYGNEEAVGAALSRVALPRDELLLCTKLGLNQSRAEVHASVAQSLSKLRVDYLDLLLMHWPNTEMGQQETLDAATELIEHGLVRAIGVSNFTAAQLREVSVTYPITMNQVEYHPYLAQPALLGEAERLGQALAAYAPLARGRVVDDPVLIEIATDHGKTPGQVALRWLVQQPRVVAIPKTSDQDRRRENIDVFDFVLSEDEMHAISALASTRRLVDPPFAPCWDT